MDSAEHVDDLAEAGEAHLDEMIDGDACEVLDRQREEFGPGGNSLATTER